MSLKKLSVHLLASAFFSQHRGSANLYGFNVHHKPKISLLTDSLTAPVTDYLLLHKLSVDLQEGSIHPLVMLLMELDGSGPELVIWLLGHLDFSNLLILRLRLLTQHLLFPVDLHLLLKK